MNKCYKCCSTDALLVETLDQLAVTISESKDVMRKLGACETTILNLTSELTQTQTALRTLQEELSVSAVRGMIKNIRRVSTRIKK